VMHAILKSNTKTLTSWAQTLSLPSDKVCFFNFTASHDGIGLRPVKEILSDEEINFLVQTVEENEGLVSYREESDGTQSPYELNCSYIDALTPLDAPDNLRIKRMLLSQGTALVMPGVPGIYFHSLVGSRNYLDGVKHTGKNRSINREKYHYDWLEDELSKEGNLAKTMLNSYKRLISIRTNESAFNPFGAFTFYDIDERLFVVRLMSLDQTEMVLAIHNFANETVTCSLPEGISYELHDLLSSFVIDQDKNVTLSPYQMMWLKQSLPN